MQGDVFGPIQCSVSVDTYGKECILEDKHLYTYKDGVQVPALAMVDDVLIVTECGYKSTMANAFINTKSNMKKLQYGTNKCHKMHVGRRKNEDICPDLFVDGWKLKEVSEIDTGIVEDDLVDDYDGLQKMDEVTDEKYLGDVLSADGKNLKNITTGRNKSIGTRNQIMGILQDVYYGRYYFQVAKILRNALFLSSLLTNCEAWYNVSTVDRDLLEEADENLLRSILECPVTTPKEMLYLELNCLPIRYILMKRRLHFLYYILSQKKDSLIYQFFQAQLRNSVKGDWSITVQEDLEILGIETPINQITNLSESTYTKMIGEKIEGEALRYLNCEKDKHSKVKHMSHKKMEMQDYLSPNNLSNDDSKLIFLLRSRMLDVKCNYKGKYIHSNTLCPVCKKEEDTQAHILECADLNVENQIVTETIDYDKLFSDKLNDKISVAKVIKERFKRRKDNLKKKAEEEMP